MSVKLTKADVKALDYLIAALEEEQKGARIESVEVAAFPAAIVAVTARAVPVVVRATPAVARVTAQVTPAIVGAQVSGTAARELADAKIDLPEGLSLEQLKELRSRINI